jgi:hypothetical protein
VEDPDIGTVWLGSAAGCAIGACPPAAGVGLGIGVIALAFREAEMASNPCGGCAIAFLGTLLGIVIAGPSVAALGPCSSVGAGLGGATQALFDDRSPGPALLGAAPGIGVAVLGIGASVVGLAIVSNTSEPVPFVAGQPIAPGWTLVATGLLLGATAGPISAAGATWADLALREEPDASAAAPAATRAVPEPATQVAKMTMTMAY